MGKTIAIANQKGGVGKTTTVVAMGGALSELGFRCLLIDVDDSGNPSLTKSLCLSNDTNLTDLLYAKAMKKPVGEVIEKAVCHHEEGFDVICADSMLSGITNFLNGLSDDETKRMLLKDVISEIKDNYDYILLDAAPSLNIMSINLLCAADEIIITSQAQGASEKGIEELLESAMSVHRVLNPELIVAGLLITMVDYRTKYNSDKVANMMERYRAIGMRVFNSCIPRSVRAEEWSDSGKSIIGYASSSAPAQAYRAFVKEYLGLL